MTIITALVGAVWFVAQAQASKNGLAITPAMGWDNWNAYGCDLDSKLILRTASSIVANGLRDAGYHYVILDDCWSAGRNSSGNLVANLTKFPGGMGVLGDKLHAMNLGFGMYSSAGVMTCAKYDGSLYHEEIDAKTFASWGVDYLKYDNCFNQGEDGTPQLSFNRYNKMSVALNKTGRPILYNMCNWGQDGPWNWAATIANSWRISGDITDFFDRPDPRCPCYGPENFLNCALPGFHCSIMNIIGKIPAIADKGGPGGWNDMDALEIGNGGLSDDEEVLHMTMWAIAKSPLILGTDITTLAPSSYSILINPAIIAINQDPLGESAFQRWTYDVADTDPYGEGSIQMWAGSLSNGDTVVVLLNAGTHDRMMNATLTDIFSDDGGAQSTEAASSWDLYDLWANRMPNSMAQAALNGTSLANIQGFNQHYWNVTAKSYADGILANNTVLMGTKVGSVAPLGTITAKVNAHGVKAWRMKPSSRKSKRDEL